MSGGLLLLVLFTPLAFGTVEPWSVSIMEIGAAALLVLHASRHGVSLPGSRPTRAILFLFLALTALVLAQLLPLPAGFLGLVSPATLALWQQFAADAPGGARTLSINPDATRQELLKLVSYAAVFFVVARHCRSRARALLLAKGILFTAGLLSVLAIAQKLTWNGRILWFYPLDESLRSGFRIWGPYVNHNHFAGYLEMAIPLGLGLLVYALPRETPAAVDVPGGRVGRFLANGAFAPVAGLSLLVLFLSACLLATLSRGAIVASAFAGSVFAVLIWRKNPSRRRLLALLLAGGVFVAAVLLPTWGRVAQRFEDIEEKQQVSRLHVLADSLGILGDFPLLGTGLGTFERIYGGYQRRYPTLVFDHAHNDYLEMATDTGVAGFLLAAGMAATFLVALLRGWGRRRSRFCTCVGAGGICSCLALAVHGAVDFNLRIPANALLFAMIAGLTHATIFSPSGRGGPATPDPSPASPDRRAPSRLPLALAAVPVALLLLFLPARSWRADQHYRSVERILDDPATEALDLQPIAAETMPAYLAAIESLERAAALEPSRSAYPQALADLYARLGEWARTLESLRAPLPAGTPASGEALTAAAAQLRRAIALDPANPDLHLALGKIYAAADGGLARADPQIQLALAARPAGAHLRYLAAMLYLLDGDGARALEQARVLAGVDDSYLVAASERKSYQAGTRARPYLARLKASYLFKALEIAWRATGDVALTRSIAPQNDDARAVVALFLEWKGLER